MKRKIVLLISLLILTLALSACSPAKDPSVISSVSLGCEEIRQAIAQTQSFYEQASPSETEIFTYLGLNSGLVADMAMTMDASLTTPDTIAVITATDDKAVMQVKSAMEEYVATKKDEFQNLYPEQLPKLENAVIRVRDNQAVLIICDDPDAAIKALTAIWE